MRLDETIEGLVAPLAEDLAGLVFFEVPLFGGEWPFVVLWLVAGSSW